MFIKGLDGSKMKRPDNGNKMDPSTNDFEKILWKTWLKIQIEKFSKAIGKNQILWLKQIQ